MSNTQLANEITLTALDRCDRCGAQALVRVLLTSGDELLFCAHHAREHADKLRSIEGAVIDDPDGVMGVQSPS